MAIATDSTFGSERARAVGTGIVTAGDRTQDFRRARRHSVLVRVLRIAFPLSCVALVAVYALSVLDTAGWGTSLPQLAMPRIIPENLTMDNPRYAGFNKDGGAYVVTAKTAVQDLKQLNNIKLNGITGELTEVDKSKTVLTATRGTMDTKTNVLELYDAIDVVAESGMRAKLTRATVLSKEGLVTSKEPVLVEMKGGSVRSNEMTLRQKLREVTFVNSVVAHLVPPADGAPKAAGSSQTRLLGSSNAPVDVTANRLDIKDGEKLAIFTGNVVAVQGEAKLSTPEMAISYESQSAGAAQPSSALSPDASKVRRILAKGPVVMTRGEADNVTSDAADFDALNEKAFLTGNVVMTSGADRRAVSDAVELDTRNDTALLSGDIVTVTQGKNVLNGRRLFVDRKSGRTQLTAPPGNGRGVGRITAHLVQNQTTAAKPAKAAAQPVAAEKGLGLGASTFKTDPNAPIDIESDSLDVDDRAKAAVFRGKVVAVQGGFKIEGAELEANYKGEAAIGDVAQSSAAGKSGSSPAPELTRIKVRKNVVVTGTDGQTATGDWADFDPGTNTAVIGGDVVLTEGKNVVRGTKLVIDMASGQSVIQSEEPKTSATNGKDGWVADTRNQVGAPAKASRPSATFYIDSKKAGAKEHAPHPAAKSATPSNPEVDAQGRPVWSKDPASSSWESITGRTGNQLGN